MNNQELKDLAQLITDQATPSFLGGIDFFSLKGELKKINIKSDYLNTVYLKINYKNKDYCMTNIKNAEPSDSDLIFLENYVIGPHF